MGGLHAVSEQGLVCFNLALLRPNFDYLYFPIIHTNYLNH